MPKIAYIEKRFQSDSRALIRQANEIIEEYATLGFSLTLRQLYYQFVARDYLENTAKAYHRLGNVINDARLAGLIDWQAIVDRTRNLQKLSHWNNPSEIVQTCAKQYHIDMWANQEYYVEVWVEKQALEDIVARAAEPLDVPYFACRGYVSQSEMWEAAQRIWRKTGQDEQTRKGRIIHLGDHDPSGIDMTRDIIDRLEMFTGFTSIERIALNIDQIKVFNPPPNYAKVTDSRFKDYQKKFGDDSWELDALDPTKLFNLIDKKIRSYIDEEQWEIDWARRQEGRDTLQEIADDLAGRSDDA